jgi:hypothetical protein
MIKVWMTSHGAPLYDLPFGFGSIVHHYWWREIKGVKGPVVFSLPASLFSNF